MSIISKFLMLFVLLSMIYFTDTDYYAKQHQQLTKAQWQQDTRFLLTKIKLFHPNPWRALSEKQFQLKLDELNNNSHRESRKYSITRLMSALSTLTSSGRDSVTGIWPLQDATSFHVFPLQLYWFNDGIYIIGTDNANKELLGYQLTEIAGLSVKNVIQKVKPYVNQVNPIWIKNLAPLYMMIPEVIESAGISRGLQVAITVVNKQGKPENKLIKAIKSGAYKSLFPLLLRGINHNRETKNTTFTAQNKVRAFWFKPLNKTSLYVQYNHFLEDNSDELSFIDFIDQVEIEIRKVPVSNLIIDLRNHTGIGDPGSKNSASGPLLMMLKNLKAQQYDLDQYVMIGRSTLSTVLKLITELENRYNAIFIGEPTGGSPNQFGHPQTITLPNSRLEISIASRFLNIMGIDNKQLSYAPDYLIELSSTDYYLGRDSVLQKIQELIELKSLEE